MKSVLVEIQLPKDWDKFCLPPALAERLQELLDRQDVEGHLSKKDRSEAKALAELVDILTVIKLGAERATAAVKR
jgi:hypothetical protein